MSSSNGTSKKRPLTFVSEGVADLETQKAKEQVEQAKFEAECKRRERKTLREQLRANAINKQKEFNGLVKERDDLNRLSSKELDYYTQLEENERKKQRELNAYLDKQSESFDSRQSRLKDAQDRTDEKPVTPLRRTVNLTGIVKKSKRSKKKLAIKQATSTSISRTTKDQETNS